MVKKKKDSRFKTRRGRLSIIAGLVTLAVAIVIVYIFVKGGGKLDLSVIRDLGIGDSSRPADAFVLDADRSEVVGVCDNGFCAVGKLGVTILDKAGEEQYRDTVPMKRASVKTAGKYAAVYDIGGKTALICNSSGVTARISADGEIVDASINEAGWFTVCAQEGGGYKGSCSVYNDAGEKVFRFDSSEGYLISAHLTDDSKSVYILTLTSAGSRIVLFNLNSEEEQWSVLIAGEVVFELKGARSDGIRAISDKSLTAISRSGEQNKIFDFDGKNIGGYSIQSGQPIALLLLDYGVGTKGRLITLTESGEILGTMDTDRRLKDIYSAGKHVYVLWADVYEVYNTKLTETLETGGSGSARAIIARDSKETYLVDGNEAIRIDSNIK